MPPGLIRSLVLLLGFVCVALGLIGALVPLMPSTIFFLGAVACFAYANPRLEKWLMSFEIVATPVMAWRERGAIPLRAKIVASLGMILGFALFALSGVGAIGLSLAAIFLAASALFIWTRPG